MQTYSLDILSRRLEDSGKAKRALAGIDALRRKAPKGWNSVEFIRKMREERQ